MGSTRRVGVKDENEITISVLSSLQDNCLRTEPLQEDPREGGGDLSMTTMISENIVDMVEKFCNLAKNATSGAGEMKLLIQETGGTPTEELLHDIKVAGILVCFFEFTNIIRCIFVHDQILILCVVSAKGVPHKDPSRVTKETF